MFSICSFVYGQLRFVSVCAQSVSIVFQVDGTVVPCTAHCGVFLCSTCVWGTTCGPSGVRSDASFAQFLAAMDNNACQHSCACFLVHICKFS